MTARAIDFLRHRLWSPKLPSYSNHTSSPSVLPPPTFHRSNFTMPAHDRSNTPFTPVHPVLNGVPTRKSDIPAKLAVWFGFKPNSSAYQAISIVRLSQKCRKIPLPAQHSPLSPPILLNHPTSNSRLPTINNGVPTSPS